MISKDEIKERINELESMLDTNEEFYHSLNSDDYCENKTKIRILWKCYNIESQLEALYYVLGKQYVYRYR